MLMGVIVSISIIIGSENPAIFQANSLLVSYMELDVDEGCSFYSDRGSVIMH
jgi:hypothetical protein